MDVRGFTALSERVSPEELVRRLNRFYAIAVDVVIQLDGTLDKFVGDQVMAFFGAPFQKRGHAQRAVQAAHAIVAGTMSLGEDEPLGVGGGIATGEALVGNVAGGDVRDFTVMGDTVNVAARLQGAAQAGEILMTEETYQAVARLYPDAPVRRLELKGKSSPVLARVVTIERVGDLMAEARGSVSGVVPTAPPAGPGPRGPALAAPAAPATGAAVPAAAKPDQAGPDRPATTAPAAPAAAIGVPAAAAPLPAHQFGGSLTATRGKAAVFRGPNEPFEIKEFPVPDPEPGAALIKVSLANICGSDLHIWRGELGQGYPPNDNGYIIGHEMTGRIAALGDALSTDSLGRPLAVGDRVAYCYFSPCGRCRACQRGDRYACPNKTRWSRVAGSPPYFVAAYGEYYYLRPGAFVYQVPDELSDDLVAPINCALSQVLFGWQHIGLKFGDRVVIQGAGGLGLYATAAAKELGAEKVIVVDGLANRLELARQFGADETIDIGRHGSVRERVGIVRELTDGLGADIAVDLAGRPEVIPEGLAMIRDGGRYLEIGCICPGLLVELDTGLLVRHGKRIVAILHYDPGILPDAIEFVRRNQQRLPFDSLLSHKFPLEDINEAFHQAEWFGRAEAGPITRAALVPGG